MHLHIQVNQIPSNKAIEIDSNNKYKSVFDRLLEMGYNKSEIINKILLYKQSNATPQFVYNTLIDTLKPNTVE